MNALFRRIRQLAPTLLVLGLLGLLAWWGHGAGWKAPKFSSLFGRAETAAKEDWCEAHNVPDSVCIACHPELGGASAADWCKEHGVAESKCTVCHPEILTKGKSDDWCGEHGVPESQCTVCHPEIAVRGGSPPSPDDVHAGPEPGAKPAKDPRACLSHALRVQFASAEAVRKCGVRVEEVRERPLAATVRAVGEIDYDPDLTARLSAPVAGRIRRIDRRVGDAVKKGDVLALLDSAEVGRARAELLQTLAEVDVKGRIRDRLRTSTESGFRTQGELQEAEAAFREAGVRRFNARQALLNLGLPVRDEDLADLSADGDPGRIRFLGLPGGVIRSLDPDEATANLLPVVSPLDGTVITREGAPGEDVDREETLFVVADVRRMAVVLEVRPEEADLLASGQPVLFRPDGADEAAEGRVVSVATAADEKTRTVKVRADVENSDGKLRAHVFGTGRITVREETAAVVVPDEAVHWEGCCHVVFVRKTDEIFLTRKVSLGARAGGYVEVRAGVAVGEVVVTKGGAVLKAEILKGSLGAGCVD